MSGTITFTDNSTATAPATLAPSQPSTGGGPLPGDLPNLPAGIAYVANATEARALLAALKPGFGLMMDEVEDLILETVGDVSGIGGWDFTDTTSITGLTITSNRSITTDPDNFFGYGWDFEVGQIGTMVSNEETITDVTANKTASGVVVYEGSKVVEKGNFTVRYDILGLLDSGLKMRINGSGEESAIYTLAVSNNGKGGKIILNVHLNGSFNNVEWTFAGGDGDLLKFPYTYSGSLKVYGANDQVQYTLNITNEATYQQAMNYFD
jgi:hypothetical protein